MPEVVRDWLAAGSAPPEVDPTADGLLQLVPLPDVANGPAPKRAARRRRTAVDPAAKQAPESPTARIRTAPVAKRATRARTAVDPVVVARIKAMPRIRLFGVQVGLETKIDLRAKVVCPYCGHGGHIRSRGFNLGTDQTADLGDAEAFAFLGQWLAGGKGLSKQEHFEYHPTAFEVRQFALMHEWCKDGAWVPADTAGSCLDP